MSRHLLALPFCIFAVLSISACVTEEQVDAKLSEGCAAAIKVLVEPREILETKSVNYSDEILVEGIHRRVTMRLLEQDGWAEMEKEYSCLFNEQWGIMKSSHMGTLVQVKLDDQIIGKENGQIKGDVQDFVRLTEVVNSAMGQ